MRPLVTCMGEGLIDFVPLDASRLKEPYLADGRETRKGEQKTKGLATDFRLYPGGSILNVARGIARLEQHTAFAGKMSDDFFGHHLLHVLQTDRVDTRFVSTTHAQSALAFAALKEGEAVFSFYGDETADTLLTIDDIPERLYTETMLLHFGSISLLRGTTPATVVSTVERLKGHALLSFDLNIRAGLIRDEPAYRAVVARLIMLADILKLSEMDLAWLLPGVPVEEALLQLSKQGPALVLITRGEHGILAQRNLFDVIQVPAFPVPVVDTVGAGDALCAGVLAQLAGNAITSHEALRELPAQELHMILRFASAVAAVNCTRASADPPSLVEVQQFLQKESGIFE